MPKTKRLLKVFLCHAHADRDLVRALYSHLKRAGVDAWLDKEKLLPGSDWELEIRKAVREADVVVVCLSKQFNQAGFRQKEVRLALDTAMEQPEGEIFIIPARLEECENLESLRKWHWVDLFEDNGYQSLIRALRARADRIGAELQETKHSLTIKETQLKDIIAQADEVANTDELTFLPNRRQIMADLQREVILSDRYDTPLSISMLDIDHFKKINDTYGHIAGDEVLQKLAGELRQRIRQPDTIGRYEGDVFLIIFPHSTLNVGVESAERLCQHIRSTPIIHARNVFHLTISAGIAQYKTHEEDWRGFLDRADKALYQAKNNGRDQWAIIDS